MAPGRSKGRKNELVVDSSYVPPLQKHLQQGEVKFVTIKVKIFLGESESDFKAKFDPGPLYASKVINVVADRYQLTPTEAEMFRLWIVGTDIEIQVRPKQDVFELLENWHLWVEKYTHYPESKNPSHPINKHWFVLRRAALSTDDCFIDEYREQVVSLIFGEAVYNIQSLRYPATIDDLLTLAGFQLQIAGDYDPLKHPENYLQKFERWHYVIPEPYRKQLKPKVWQERLFTQWKKNKGKSAKLCRAQYVEHCKQWPYYGNCFFPCCEILPPGGCFELRTQKYLLGVGTEGIVILNKTKGKMIFNERWSSLLWEFGQDNIKLVYKKQDNEKHKKMTIITPQSIMVENVISRAIYLVQKAGRSEKLNTNNTDGGVGRTRSLKVPDGAAIVSSGSSRRFSQVRQQRSNNAFNVTTTTSPSFQKVSGVGICVDGADDDL